MRPLAHVLSLPSIAFLGQRLDRARAARSDDLLGADSQTMARASEALRAIDARHSQASNGAAEELEAIASGCLAELRARIADEDVITRGAERLDGALRTDTVELLDRDAVPIGVKRLGMRLLHRVNDALGAYAAWVDVVDAALGDRTFSHVYDLAAGTGGFARYLAAHRPARVARVTSSDLDAGYVAIGADIAARENLDVRFEVRDALDLRGVRDVDLFVCTQATHHLSPGQAVRMIAQAARAAPRGIVIVDLVRSLSVLLGTGLVLLATAPFPPLVFDGLVSVRRSYTVAELTLLARLSGARHVEAKLLGAAHCTLHAWNG